MADQDCNKINLPLALSSSSSSWWDFHHHATCPTSSWNNTDAASSPVILWENQNNSNSSQCDQEVVSITASNHSTLTVDESFQRIVEPSSSNNVTTGRRDYNSNPWNQFLIGIEGSQKMHGNELRDEVGENLLDTISLKSFSDGMFEPNSTCSDYLQNFGTHHHEKWIDKNGDQYLNSNSPDNIRRIAAPEIRSPMVHHLVLPHPFYDTTPTDQYIHPDDHSDQTKQKLAYQQQFSHMGPNAGSFGIECYSYILDKTRLDNYHLEDNNQGGPSLGALISRENVMLKQHDYTRSVLDPFNQSHRQMSSEPAALKSLSLLETRNMQGTVKNEGRGRGKVAYTNVEKNKRSDNGTSRSSSSLKKIKHESSSCNPSSTASSSAKVRDTQTPKVKIAAEKISALQQIVSPYGKTDTASVLQEAIGFIKCHQEQVQLLSNAYLKSNVNKLQEAWRSINMKYEKGDRINKVLDLNSKGLCLVPTSSIPQVYMESAGPDYWPGYRGCMYR